LKYEQYVRKKYSCEYIYLRKVKNNNTIYLRKNIHVNDDCWEEPGDDCWEESREDRIFFWVLPTLNVANNIP
jgi:hypothetical protein